MRIAQHRTKIERMANPQSERAVPKAIPLMAMMTLMAAVALPSTGLAQEAAPPVVDHPVVLELYTAQGCISCPPADDMMLELALRDDVFALALHVDYWDYIGWVDSFADPEYGQRQQRYARRQGQSTIYTPQVIVNGSDVVEGFRVRQVMDTIDRHRRRSAEIQMDLARVGDSGLEIRAEPIDEVAPLIAMASRRSAMPNSVSGTLRMGDTVADAAADVGAAYAGEVPAMSAPGMYSVQVVRYRAEDFVEIRAGENAGRMGRYANIVTSWEAVGSWDMASALEMTVPLAGADPVVVIVQEAGQGEIVAAARLR